MFRYILLLIICIPILANCCSCEGKETVKEAINNSDVVFIGRVISKKIIDIVDDNLLKKFKLKKAEYIISVSEIYKGETKKRFYCNYYRGRKWRLWF